MGKFLKFEKMITPIIIQIIFWLGVIGSLISGIASMGFGIFSDGNSFLSIITGLAIMLIGPIIVRIYCEMLIVIFTMQGALVDIRDHFKQQDNIQRHDKAV